MEKKIKLCFVHVLLSVLMKSVVDSKPLTNNVDQSNSWIVDSILSARSSDPNSSGVQSTIGHTFIKVDKLQDQTSIPNGASITVQGDSSMRLFNDTDINHPNFDPSDFLKQARNESFQSVEVQPVSGLPYFMFIPPALLKNQVFKTLLFGNMNKRRRIKRHHPSTIQNVLGELQNYALVPIKSNNGRIRYILLKNPKFVIGNQQVNGVNGQPAPAIIQLNSNLPAATPGGKIRYTPRSPVEPVTQATFRRVPSGRRPAWVPVAKPIDSNFNTQRSETSRSNSQASTSQFTKRTISSLQTVGNKPIPRIPPTWQELRRNFVAQKPTRKPISGTGFNPTDGAKTIQVGGTNTIPIVGINNIVSKTQTQSNSKPFSKSKTTSVQQSSSSVAADKITSSAGSLKQSGSGLKASVANTTLANEEGNTTNVNKTNTKNITITKVGDKHKIQQTEVVETVVDVKKNATATKSGTASSKVVSGGNGHGHDIGHNHGGHGNHGSHRGHEGHGGHGGSNTVSANTGAAEKAVAEKQAQVVKKTKKTTTILMKPGTETKSGKAEISEIQHTVEELVHHNTSETAAAETAASAKVDTPPGDAHASHSHHSHDHGHGHGHGHVHSNEAHPAKQEKVAIADAKKETNSTSTSVKTKSVKKTVIKKKVPDPSLPVSSNSAVQPGTSGTAAGTHSGQYDVQHVEHVVQETEHKTQQDTSQTSKHKAKSSVGNHDHHHHH